ncbi:MAG: Lrp/AsnC family transcriptional regulator [Desulfobacterales bacterium]|nr:Lrp/AsnC family transcriptional regulator [Desulfobacterales bacterium]
MGLEIDKVDSKIICLLQENGRMPNTEIAQKLGISEATIRKRIQRLIKDGIIKIVAACDPFKVGFNVVGNMHIKLDIKKSDQAIKELKELDELWYISLVSGTYDLDIEFRLRSIDELHSLLYDRIYPIEGVLSTNSSFTLKYIKDSYNIGTALEYDED